MMHVDGIFQAQSSMLIAPHFYDWLTHWGAKSFPTQHVAHSKSKNKTKRFFTLIKRKVMKGGASRIPGGAGSERGDSTSSENIVWSFLLFSAVVRDPH